MSPDDEERVHTVVYVYSVPGSGGEQAAADYAAFLPDVPPPPEIVPQGVAWRMISDREIWQCALLIVKRYKADAMLEAAARAGSAN